MPNTTVEETPGVAWVPPRRRQIVRWPLAGLKPFDRFLTKAIAMFGSRYIVSVTGTEHVRHELDPFVFAASHNNYREALYVPALLMLIRRGHLFHFLGDWNVRLYPGVNLLYRRFQVITVTRKPCHYKVLNRLMPLFAEPGGALNRAKEVLAQGKSVGIFPEGIVNHSPDRLLRGHSGAAFLSIATGAPVIPVGLALVDDARGPGRTGLVMRIGAPLDPRAAGHTNPTRDAVTDWHATIMTRIGELAGKSWSAEPRPQRKKLT